MVVAQLMQDLEWLTVQITTTSEQPEGLQLNQDDLGLGKLCISCRVGAECNAVSYGACRCSLHLVRLATAPMAING